MIAFLPKGPYGPSKTLQIDAFFALLPFITQIDSKIELSQKE